MTDLSPALRALPAAANAALKLFYYYFMCIKSVFDPVHPHMHPNFHIFISKYYITPLMQVQALSLYLPPCVYVCVAYIREKDYKTSKQNKIKYIYIFYYCQEQISKQKKKSKKPNSLETSRGHWCSVNPPPAAPQCAEFTHCQWLKKKTTKKIKTLTYNQHKNIRNKGV